MGLTTAAVLDWGAWTGFEIGIHTGLVYTVDMNVCAALRASLVYGNL